MNPSLKVQGGWKQFYISNGKLVRFYVPLGVKRRRGYCPKCKVWFTLCPFEEKLPIYHHYLCANRYRLTPDGKCQYVAMGLKPPSCGAEIGRAPKCKSCLYFAKATADTACPILTFHNPETESCELYVHHSCKNWKKWCHITNFVVYLNTSSSVIYWLGRGLSIKYST